MVPQTDGVAGLCLTARDLREENAECILPQPFDGLSHGERVSLSLSLSLSLLRSRGNRLRPRKNLNECQRPIRFTSRAFQQTINLLSFFLGFPAWRRVAVRCIRSRNRRPAWHGRSQSPVGAARYGNGYPAHPILWLRMHPVEVWKQIVLGESDPLASGAALRRSLGYSPWRKELIYRCNPGASRG